MGISACELLMTVVKMAKSRSLSFGLRAAFRDLMALSDVALARDFLVVVYTPMWYFDESHSAEYKKNAWAVIRKSLHTKFKMTTADIDDGIDDLPTTPTQQASSEPPRKSSLPTLASTIRSSELSSMRRLRDRIAESARGENRVFQLQVPSSVFTGRPATGVSFPSMTDLSTALESLSIPRSERSGGMFSSHQ
ncbi:hypothetical protein NA57DRAFT_54704 [Rhizodiscina lignyota]|uniref:Uncharacterized protein n=1 Tax=Rhizodiscina lignyota TaxID=1504668 RepID=A0A9P4IF62_9PEZI|nr:hypothetical protein NA57DRAFT_54704 [Rhizodiscina lignyota]